jgi:hypothetical protein
MTHSLKTLGLVLVAMLALGALVASGASALQPRLTVEKYPATLSGEQTAGASNEFVAEGGRTSKCENVKYSGTYTEVEAKGESGGAVSALEYIGCTVTLLGNITPATITMNGCQYRFTAGTFVSETEATGKEVHLECPTGKVIEEHIWQTSAKHLESATPLCTYTFAPQTAKGSVSYKIGGTAETPHTYLTIVSKVTVALARTTGTVTNCGAASQTGEGEAAAKVEARNSGELLHPTWKNEE